MTTGDPLLTARDVGAELGGRPVLRGVDLDVTTGDVLTVLGANGSGKSTLVRTLLGLVPLRRGDVRLFGTPLPRFRQWHRVGYVPQRPTAAAGVPASVREVVAAGRLARRGPLRPPAPADRLAVEQALEAVDLRDHASDGVATLSGGQQQRALIARALAGGPELLVLDEPTAGVDVGHQEDVADILRGLVGRGLTVLLVAHELGPLADLVTRTVVMRDGRVAYDGAPLASFQDAGPVHHHHHHPAGRAATSDWSPDLRTPLDRARRSAP